MCAESGIQDDLTMRQDVSGLVVMDHGRRHQAQTGVVVLVVVPLEEGLAEAASVFDGVISRLSGFPWAMATWPKRPLSAQRKYWLMERLPARQA
jgi:hypothetical protein